MCVFVCAWCFDWIKFLVAFLYKCLFSGLLHNSHLDVSEISWINKAFHNSFSRGHRVKSNKSSFYARFIGRCFKSYQRRLTDNDLKPRKPSLHSNTHTLWLIRPIDQSLTSLWGDKFIEEAGQFVFMASVTRSAQDSKRVHVHLMVRERTMAAAEWTPILRMSQAMQDSFQLKSMVGQWKPKSVVANKTAGNVGIWSGL